MWLFDPKPKVLASGLQIHENIKKNYEIEASWVCVPWKVVQEGPYRPLDAFPMLFKPLGCQFWSKKSENPKVAKSGLASVGLCQYPELATWESDINTVVKTITSPGGSKIENSSQGISRIFKAQLWDNQPICIENHRISLAWLIGFLPLPRWPHPINVTGYACARMFHV